LDYKKIIIYLIIILAASGYWLKNRLDKQYREDTATKFAHVYAGTAVMKELYRHDPESFYHARDSIYREYDFNADSIEKYRKSFEGREEEWTPIWIHIRHLTDSLVDYFKANPLEPIPTDSSNVTDSGGEQ